MINLWSLNAVIVAVHPYRVVSKFEKEIWLKRIDISAD
ncbi:hypothetical protein FM107_11365 [Sphingobacterium sp. JB170]|nr:hypothetical protein FM107_11365 [Sphingobacterium sp. JB170]